MCISWFMQCSYAKLILRERLEKLWDVHVWSSRYCNQSENSIILVISLSSFVMIQSVNVLRQDYGEESEGLHIVQEYVKSH